MASARLQTRLLFLTAVIFAASALSSQSGGKSATPDLTKFSSDQLTACYNDLKPCGAKDIWAISDEFTRRLPSLSSERLVACFNDWHICGVGEGQASGWEISDELARRGQIHSLILRYWHETNWVIRDGIEHVAYHFHNPEVTAFMRKVLAERVYDGEDRYWPVNYLAKKCDPSALRELSSGRYRNQGSMQYQTSVELFGKCHYRPAIPYLVDTALYDFSGNITDAADDSLHALYPDAPKDFDSLQKSQEYFCQRALKEHLKVNCKVPQSQ
jgi:hypothetical protein